MERKLLLLGLLRTHEMHGYQINELIDIHLGSSIQLKKPTAYKLLNQMVDDGWLDVREEREGNYPPRQVFSITPNGDTAFHRMLRESLADYKPVTFPGNIGLAFLDVLPAGEAVELLQQRREIIEGLLQTIETDDKHQGGFQLLLTQQQRHLRAELEWVDEVIANLIPV
jgi:DNA-binding PadR family transcriptional regulator